jgi:exopolyphosphatase/pppGpp-phosphohydrolase
VDPALYREAFRLHPSDQKRHIIRFDRTIRLSLANAVLPDGTISCKGVTALIRSARQLRDQWSRTGLRLDELHAFGTSLFREAKNIKEVIRDLANKTGIDLKILPETLEATIGVIGMVRSMVDHVAEGSPIITVVIGGGSTEISLASRRGTHVVIHQRVSLDLGSKVVLNWLDRENLSSCEHLLQVIGDYVTARMAANDRLRFEGDALVLCIGGCLRQLVGWQKEGQDRHLQLDHLEQLLHSPVSEDLQAVNIQELRHIFTETTVDDLPDVQALKKLIESRFSTELLLKILREYGANAATYCGLGLQHALAHCAAVGLDIFGLDASTQKDQP